MKFLEEKGLRNKIYKIGLNYTSLVQQFLRQKGVSIQGYRGFSQTSVYKQLVFIFRVEKPTRKMVLIGQRGQRGQ